uniref:Uncharacterized protein n=1 Tax=Knipowitschia caucasica TaxID=637954 RepID=A0AAV2K289_KNICA
MNAANAALTKTEGAGLQIKATSESSDSSQGNAEGKEVKARVIRQTRFDAPLGGLNGDGMMGAGGVQATGNR